MTTRFAFALSALFVTFATGCAASTEPTAAEATEQTTEDLRIGGGLGLDGDSCTYGTAPDGSKIPGTEKDGECCKTSDPTDCTIILKNPFPTSYTTLRAF